MISVIGNRGGTFLRAAMSEGAEDGVVSVIGGGGLAESSITFPYTGPERVDQQNLSSNVVTGSPAAWQSFTPGVNGYLSSFAVYLEPVTSRNMNSIRVYRGEGGGELLYEKTDIHISGGGAWRYFRPEYAVELTVGQKHTIYLHVPLGSGWRFRTYSVYPGGRSSVSANFDMTFQTFTPDI